MLTEKSKVRGCFWAGLAFPGTFFRSAMAMWFAEFPEGPGQTKGGSVFFECTLLGFSQSGTEVIPDILLFHIPPKITDRIPCHCLVILPGYRGL